MHEPPETLHPFRAGSVIKQGKKLFEKLTGKRDTDPVLEQQRMFMAYGLICYTSYFDALDQKLPEVKRLMGLTAEDRFALSAAAAERLQKQSQLCGETGESERLGSSSVRLSIPHPAESFDRVLSNLLPLYANLTKGVTNLLEAFAAWESSTDQTRKEILELIRQLPDKAAARFEGQYFSLCSKYHDFYVWANLHEHASTHNRFDRFSKDFQTFAARVATYREHIDLGFSQLSELIASVPAGIEARHAEVVFTELERTYLAAIDEPIIKDPSPTDPNKPSLIYPKKAEIFVPQSFKVLRYAPGQQLEDESAWANTPARKDLGQFLVSYFSSPYSTVAPLIILGHPGCGKSLLSQMLAARFVSDAYTPIRVELRSIEADNELEVQIEQQIRKDTGRITSFASLTEHLNNRPALIIFDGYDELLQASGQVFASYIMKVQKFQEREAKVLERNPLRAIITSRLSLINKASVPSESTVIRLLEFDSDQQQKWISVWNSANAAYFEGTGTQPFELLSDNKNVRLLAEQPLLLLMLALYDSSGNKLRTNRGLDQTLLYDSLLKQFIEREHLKSPDFRSLPSPKRSSEIDADLERLGAAAIGMFNRRSLHIRMTQLDADLAFLKLERAVPQGSGHILSQAELLLGSFFFVHKSKSEHKGEHTQEREADVAFEFLHNTFGEFLAGDFIIRRLLRETTKLGKLRQDPDLRVLREQVNTDADGLPADWFASLMFAPFFLRPVVLEMMREWFRHRLKGANKEVKDCLADFEYIVNSHIRRFLFDRSFPTVMTQTGRTSFGDLPLQGYLAIYTLNLITMAAVLSPGEFIFDEPIASPLDERPRMWDRLGHLWQAWFAPDTLNGLVAIFVARREDGKVILRARESFRTTPVRERLDTVLNVALALGDDTSVSLAGISQNELVREPTIELGEIQRRATAAGLDLNFELLNKRIRHFFWGLKSDAERTQLQQDCQHAIREADLSKVALIVDMLQRIRAAGEYQMYVELTAELVERTGRMGWRGEYGLQMFIALSRSLREWPFWGAPYHMFDIALSDFDVVTRLGNADLGLEVAQLALRAPQRGLSPEVQNRLVKRFEDVDYVASASPDRVVEFVRPPGSRRPPLLSITQHLLQYFISARRLFSMPPEIASELLSIARRLPFRQLCKKLCAELESSDWLPREEHSFFWHRFEWEMRRHDNLGITLLAARSVRLRNELLQAVLTCGSPALKEKTLLESLARPMPANTDTGVAVLKLANTLGKGETLLSSISEMKRTRPVGTERQQGLANVFIQIFRIDLEAAPISAIQILRWFAQLCKDERLSARIEVLAARAARPIDQQPLFSTDDE
jgi:adenylate kinase family enzyme